MRKVNRNTIITKRRAGILVCLLLALFLASMTAFADDETTEKENVDPVGDADHYSAVVYDNANGLPTAVANDIAHTKE